MEPTTTVAAPEEKDSTLVDVFQPKELEGPDAKVAELAAHRLIQAIARKDPARAEESAVAATYLVEKLATAALLRPDADTVTAGRIVDALATWIASSGPPLANTADLLLPLVGLGPPSFRDAVTRALKALARSEIATARVSATVDRLKAGFAADPPPGEGFIRDAAQILWDVDGKACLDVLVSGMVSKVGTSAGSPGHRAAVSFLEELRSRLPVDFPGVDGWQKWWVECRALPLDRILTDAQIKAREELVANWKQTIRRLRETGDAEKLSLALQDTLSGVWGPEVRVVAVVALGDFADWVLEIRPDARGTAETKPEGDPREKLQRRAVQSLAALLARKDFYGERPAVIVAALAALRKYHAFVEKAPDLHSLVASLALARLDDSGIPQGGRRREELLEAVRLVGALRAPEAANSVRRLISQDLNAVEASAEPGDLELTAASLSALGQIVERQGIDKDTATLVVGSFKKPRVGPEKAVRELKRAALTVIDTEAKGADVQAMLLALYKDVLAAPGDKDLRIPAILALGSLARQKNEEALALLGDCLDRQEQFEPQETMAAMDAVAYVGGEYALGRFLPRVVSTKDPALQAHTLKRVTGIVAEGGPELLLSTLVEVERLAMDQDSQAYLEFAVGLTVDPQLKEALSAAKLETGNDRQTELLLRLFLVQARVFDALGRDEETAQALAAVGDTLAKDLTIREKHPALVQEAAALKAQMALRTPLKAGFVQSEGAEPAAVIQSLLPLFAPDLGAATRWRNLRWAYRQIAQAPVTDRSDRIREAWQKYLASDEGKPLWTGIAPSCRDRALSRLEALKARPKSTEPPGK